MNKLKDCPFCGFEAVYEVQVLSSDAKTYRAGCHYCHIFTEWNMNSEKVAEAWNNRPEKYNPRITDIVSNEDVPF